MCCLSCSPSSSSWDLGAFLTAVSTPLLLDGLGSTFQHLIGASYSTTCSNRVDGDSWDRKNILNVILVYAYGFCELLDP